MSTHHANAAHPDHTHADAVHPAAEHAAQAQASAAHPARPEIQAQEHQNESHSAPANDAARPPVKAPESILPPEIKLPEPKQEPTHINAPAEPAPTAAEPPPAEPLKLHNIRVMPQVFEQAELKLFASILPMIEKADPAFTKGMSLKLTNELVDPQSEHGSALQITLHGHEISANYAVIAKTVNDTLREHPVLGPVLNGDNTHTMNHMTYPDGSSELQFVIPGLSSAQYAQLVQSLAGTPPLTQVTAPIAAHETLVNPSQLVSM